jgi:hypothetical protein
MGFKDLDPMIKLFRRMIPAAIHGLIRPRISASQSFSSRFRVLPPPQAGISSPERASRRVVLFKGLP